MILLWVIFLLLKKYYYYYYDLNKIPQHIHVPKLPTHVAVLQNSLFYFYMHK